MESLEKRLCLSSTTDLRVVATTGGSFTGLGAGPSVNDSGYIAFTAESLNSSSVRADNIYAYDPNNFSINTLMNPVFMYAKSGFAQGAAGSQIIDGDVQINNSNLVMARRSLNAVVQVGFPFGSILTAPLTYLETWNASAASPPGGLPVNQVAMGVPAASSSPLWFFLNPATAGVYPSPLKTDSAFEGLFPNFTINNSGQVNFSAIVSGAGNNRVSSTINATLNGRGGIGTLTIKPMLADNGNYIFTTDDGRVFLEPWNYSGALVQLAGSSNGFTNVGTAGISDDGRAVAFAATLSAAGATAINSAQSGLGLTLTPVSAGPGLYVSIAINPASPSSARYFQKIATTSGLNYSAQVSVDQLGATGKYSVAYLDTNLVGTTQTLNYTTFQPAATGVPFNVLSPEIIASQGDIVGDTGSSITQLTIHDALNASGELVFRASLSNGKQVILAAHDTPSPPPFEIIARALVYGKAWTKGQQLVHEGTELGYVVDQVFSNADGFYALGLLSDRYGPAFVSCGTDGLDAVDFLADSDPRGVGYNQVEDNWNAVYDWLHNTYLAHGPIDLTGQSLGASLTQWFASAWSHVDDPTVLGGKLIDQVVTFNSTGISNSGPGHNNLIAYASDFNPAEANSVTHYVVNGDFVSMVGDAFIPGTVELASWSGWDMIDVFTSGPLGYKDDTHQLPLTVFRTVFPADIGGTVRNRPSGLTFQHFADVSALNSPSYGHTAPEYKQFRVALQITSDANAWITGTLLNDLLYTKYAPSWLGRRDTAEAHRQDIGSAVRSTIGAYEIAHLAANQFAVTLRTEANKLLDGTRFILDQGVSLSLSTSDVGTLDLVGAIGMDHPQTLSLTIPGIGQRAVSALFNLVQLDASAHIDSHSVLLHGDMNLLNGVDAVNGTFSLDWSNGELTLSGTQNLLDGSIVSSGSVRLNGSGITAIGSANINLPSGLPWIGGTHLETANFAFRFTLNDVLADDYIAMWDDTQLFGLPVGTRLHFNGDTDSIYAQELASGGSSLIALQPPPESLGNAPSFTIVSGMTWATLIAEWQTASSAAVRLIDPTGHVYSEAAITADPNLDFTTNINTTKRRGARIENPMPGTWRIELLDTTGLGTVNYAGFANTPPAAIANSVLASGGAFRAPVQLTTNVINATQSTTVSFYLDENSSGTDGALLATDVPVVGGVAKFFWSPASVPAGPYYFYAVVSDTHQSPHTTYGATPATITEARPAMQDVAFKFNPASVLTVSFSQDVGTSLSLADVTLIDLATGNTVPQSQFALDYNAYTFTATLRSTALTGWTSGRYSLRLNAAGINNSNNVHLGQDVVFDFVVARSAAQVTLPASAVKVNGLFVQSGGRVNVGMSKLIVDYTGDSVLGSWTGKAYTGLAGMIASGRNGGTWNGTGITTSSANGNLTTLGIAEGSQALGISGSQTALFNGQTVDATSVLVKYTYGGDANLDGKINVDDYTRLDFNVALGTSGWYNGDFNYDGKINVDDYTIIDFNIGIQGTPLLNGLSTAHWSSTDAVLKVAPTTVPSVEGASSRKLADVFFADDPSLLA